MILYGKHNNYAIANRGLMYANNYRYSLAFT